jgi:uncharacterized protein involved in type VI secretion and phage assembly
MPRKAVLSAAQQAALIALPSADHDLRLHYTLSENDLRSSEASVARITDSASQSSCVTYAFRARPWPWRRSRRPNY